VGLARWYLISIQRFIRSGCTTQISYFGQRKVQNVTDNTLLEAYRKCVLKMISAFGRFGVTLTSGKNIGNVFSHYGVSHIRGDPNEQFQRH
jgi:hypothetical protein